MKDTRRFICIDLKKIAVAAVMAGATWLSCRIGIGDALLVIIPAGLAILVGEEQ